LRVPTGSDGSARKKDGEERRVFYAKRTTTTLVEVGREERGKKNTRESIQTKDEN